MIRFKVVSFIKGGEDAGVEGRDGGKDPPTPPPPPPLSNVGRAVSRLFNLGGLRWYSRSVCAKRNRATSKPATRRTCV